MDIAIVAEKGHTLAQIKAECLELCDKLSKPITVTERARLLQEFQAAIQRGQVAQAEYERLHRTHRAGSFIQLAVEE